MNTTQEMNQFRQGDILIESVTGTPRMAKRQERSRQVILAYGEMTGHQHVLETKAPTDWWSLEENPYEQPAIDPKPSEIFFFLSQGGSVNHPEHATIQLPPGLYRVTCQREYSPGAFRKVTD